MPRLDLLTLELDALFRPLRATDFVSKYFEQKFCISHHGCSALAKIEEDLGGFEVESLIEEWRPEYVAAWFDNERSGHRSMRVERRRALSLYSKGATLYFHLSGRATPDAWIAQLCSEIGIPVRGQVSVLASPKGAGTRPHFDANNNLTVQLSGRKQWSIGANERLRFPTRNYVPTRAVHPELRTSSPERVEELHPRNLEVVELLAGSVLYLPRGYWHGTKTLEGPSVSLNVLFPSFTWVELISARLRQALLGSEDWRRSCHALLGGQSDEKRSRADIQLLLDDLRRRVGSINVSHLLRQHPKSIEPILDDHLVTLCPLASWNVSQTYGENSYMIEVTDSVGLVTVVRLRRELMDVLYRIRDAEGSVLVRSLLRGHADSSIKPIRKMIARLQISGLISVELA